MWPISPPPPPPPPERDPVDPEIFRRTTELPALALPIPPPIEDQYEDLLNTVWDAERRQRMNDRIDQAVRNEEARERARARRLFDSTRTDPTPGR